MLCTIKQQRFVPLSCFFIILNGCTTCIGLQSVKAASNTTGSLSTLVTLTLGLCGSVRWCSVRIQATNTSAQGSSYLGSCCMPCSCHQNCSRLNTCCPDFKLHERVNGIIFTSAAALYNGLKEHSVSIADLRQSIEQSKSIAKEKTVVQCTYSRLKPYTHDSPLSSMYFMVTYCANNATDAYVTSKCEGSYSEHTQSSIQISDFVPVQSLTTGIVFRNKYCHECSHEKHSGVEEWNKLIISYHTPVSLFRLHASFQYIIATIASSAIDIYFEPSAALRVAFPPEPCQKIDVKECMFGNRSNVVGSIPEQALFSDAGHLESLETACNYHPLPVHAVFNGAMTVFNNLACLACNNVDTVTACKGAYRLVEIPPSRRFTASLAMDEESGQSAHVGDTSNPADETLAMSFSSQCQPGFAYDDQKFLCRKIYCPCGMIVHNQICIPIFGHIRTPFKVQVSIGNLRLRPALAQKAIRDYIYYTTESRNNFTVLDVPIICKSTEEDDPTYIANILFSGHESGTTYVEAISMAVRWFHGKATLSVDSEAVTVDMILIDWMNPLRHLLKYQTRTFDCAFFDIPTGQRSYQDSSATVIISGCSVCYRIEVLQSEVQLKSRALRVRRTGVTVLFSSANVITSNGTRVILCAEDVLGIESVSFRDSISNETKIGTKVELSTENTTLNVTAKQARFIAFGAAVVALLLVVCYIRYARKCAARSGTEAETQTEMTHSPT